MTEREITEPVELCLDNGRLNPAAVGWTRAPLHSANLRGWGRNKRFEYWCVITPELIVTVNISHHDYRANIASAVIDRNTNKVLSARVNRWLPPTGLLSDPDVSSPMEAAGHGIWVRIEPTGEGTRLRAETDVHTVDLFVEEPSGHESMGVVVPWSDRLFQYTRKNNCLRTSGIVVVEGIDHIVSRDTSLAIHDHGRGRWPYDTRWNWAAGGGSTDGHQIGLQFGGKWTEGTPSTENVLRIDGKLHKISQELEWKYDSNDWMAPWTITGDRVDLTFTPDTYHNHSFDRLVVAVRADQCFGNFAGEIVDDHGQRFRVADVYGLAEEVHRRW